LRVRASRRRSPRPTARRWRDRRQRDDRAERLGARQVAQRVETRDDAGPLGGEVVAALEQAGLLELRLDHRALVDRADRVARGGGRLEQVEQLAASSSDAASRSRA